MDKEKEGSSRRAANIKAQSLEMGKVPPQATELEESVLGALMIENNAIDQVIDFLIPDHFYKESHQRIYEAIVGLDLKNHPIDILTVTNELKEMGALELVGGAYYITQLTNRIASAANLEYHARIIHQKAMQRQLIRMSAEIIKDAYEDTTDVFDLMDMAQNALNEITGFSSDTVQSLDDFIKEVYDEIDKNQHRTNEITGIPTGLKEFDQFSNGLQKGDLIVISGETSQGKTALAVNISRNAALHGYKPIIFSYEMSGRQLAARYMSPLANISSKRMLFSKLDISEIEKINKGIEPLQGDKILVDKAMSSDISYLERNLKALVKKEKIQLAVIDYLQLIKDKTIGNKVDMIADIANKLKSLAHNLDIPILLLSQLSRNYNSPKPTLNRLKGSGDIENAADIVWSMWRPEYYGEEVFMCMGEEYTSAGFAHHMILKGRNVGTTEFVTAWDGELGLIKDKEIPSGNNLFENEDPW